MGVGRRRLAPLWALALTLACAQHTGQARNSAAELSFEHPDLPPAPQGPGGTGLRGVTIHPPLRTAPVVQALNAAHGGRVCSTWGDFHYKTFDGDVFRFPGLCNYVFSAHCGSAYEDFNLQLRRGPGPNSTAPSRVTMKLDGLVVRLAKGSILVNGRPIQLPFSQSGVLIEHSHGNLKVAAKLGLVFMWNQDDSLLLELDAKYANQTCGLCGDFNGVPVYNEFFSHNVRLTPTEFGSLQKMDGPTEQCQDPVPEDAGTCSDDSGICEEMLSSEPFSGCAHLVNTSSYLEACRHDLCHCSRVNLTSCLCHTLAEYSRQCAHAGGLPLDWRGPQLCPQTCPLNMQYRECGPPCADTCSNPERSQLCEDHCIAGCFCPEGMVLDDIGQAGCVPVSGCSCVYNGATYAPGTGYSTGCTNCTCSGGRWTCQEAPCPGTCSVLGGAHISTFDEKQYRVPGDCSYVLAKPCDSSAFTVLAELRRCGLTDSETCLKSLTLSLGGGHTVFMVKASGEVFVNQIYTQLPVSAANVTLFRPSTFFIIAQTQLGLQLDIQLVPIMQVFVRLAPQNRGQSCGLCGNFNQNQADDFRTISGVVEGSAAAFANTWKTQAACPNVKNSFEDPCSLSVENEKYAQHWCSRLTDPHGPFAQCHSAVDPSTYYSNCLFDTCNCEKSEDCMCAALSSYVRACAARGVLLSDWRDGVCTKPMATCPKSLVYRYNISTCPPTCRARSDEDATCSISFIPVDGCTCPNGTFLDDAGVCVPAASCPCYLQGSAIPNGESLHELGAVCSCTQGTLTCIGGHSPDPVCAPPMLYVDCRNATPGASGAACQKSCHALDMDCYSTKCEPGCVCPDGLVASGDGGCVPVSACPCVHNEASYQPGQTIHVGCNTCTCQSGTWQCTDQPCLATCTVYGDGHYLTFDGRRYSFSGDCEYTLLQDHCGGNGSTQDSFRVVTENVPCGTTGTTCSKAIKIFLGSYELKLSDRTLEVIETGPRPPYSIHQMGIYLVVDTELGLTLLWDKGTSIFLRLSPEFKGRVCGLCGNFDDNALNDFTTRSQSVVGDALEFGNSWKFSPSCPDALAPRDPCTANPYRRSWAQKQCSIINSATFSACHAHVEPARYYEACVSDACACDSGGDCECFCTAVAAYAQACHDAGVCVSWRTPDTCPLFCDYYNPQGQCEWHYQPCGAPCLKTCQNPSGQCWPDTRGLEGCYPKCPPEAPIFDEDQMQCVASCPTPSPQPPCHVGGQSFWPNSTVPSDRNCYSCVCTKGGVQCAYDANACVCTYDGRPFHSGDAIYHTTDGLGSCISAHCGANGTIERTVYTCSPATPAPQTTFSFSTSLPGVSSTIPPGRRPSPSESTAHTPSTAPASSPGPSTPVTGPSTPVPGTSTPVPGTTTPVPGPSTPVPGTTTPVPGPSTPVPGPSTPVPGTSTPVPGPSTSIPGTTTPVPGTSTSVTGPSTPVPGTSTPVPGTTTPVPGPSTPVPGTTTPVPGPSTPVPGPSTPVPGTSTPVPGPSTSIPGTTTPVPGTLTPVPGPSTPVPGPSTPVPGTTTPVPGPSTPVPGTTTPVPGPSTPVPGPSTPIPGTSTPVPGPSTSIPGTTTPVPGTSTPVPGPSTPVPGTTTPVPGTLTPVPGPSTPVPGPSTPVPGTTTPVPGPSTPVPGTTTPVPGPSTPVPGPSTPIPGTSTPVPGPSTSIPGTTTPVPGTSTPVPGPSTPVPGPFTSVPGPSTPVPGPSTPVPGTTTPVPGPSTTIPGTSTPIPGPSTSIPGTTTPVPGPSTPVPGTSTPVPGTSTPVPGPSTPVQGTSTPVPGPSTPVPGTSTPVQGTSTPVPGPSTPVPGPSTPIPRTSTPVPGPSTPVPGTSTPVPGTSTPVQGPSTPVPGPSTPVPRTSTPVPGPSTPIPGTSTPVPGPSTPIPGTSTPVPGPSTPVPGPSTPVPGPSTLVPGTSTPVTAPRPSEWSSPEPTTVTCLQVLCNWTEWMDGSYPGPGRNSGDFDTISNLRAEGYKFCAEPRSVQCRAERFPDTPLQELGQDVVCNKSVGLICWNKDQLPPICYNYNIRFLCCELVDTCRTNTASPATPAATRTATAGASSAWATGALSTSTKLSTASSPHMTPTRRATPSTHEQSSPGTTPCKPKCRWTKWFDVDFPMPGPRGGDNETFSNIMRNGDPICHRSESISKVECRAENHPGVSIHELGQLVQCHQDVGLLCRNQDQKGKTRLCLNYQIRVLCCEPQEHCSPATVTVTSTSSVRVTGHTGTTFHEATSSATSVHTGSTISAPTTSSTSVHTSSTTSAPTTSTTSVHTSSATSAPTTSTTSVQTSSTTSAPTTSSTSVHTSITTSAPTTSTTSVQTSSTISAPTTSSTSVHTSSPTSAPTTSTTSVHTSSATSAPTTSATPVQTSSTTSAPTTSSTSVHTGSTTSAPTPSATPVQTSSTISAPTTSATSVHTGSTTSAPTTSTTSVQTSSTTSAPTTSSTSVHTGSTTSAPTMSSISVHTGSTTSAPTPSATPVQRSRTTSAPTTSTTSVHTGSTTSAPTPSATPVQTSSTISAPTTSATSVHTGSTTSAPTTSTTSVHTGSTTSAPTTSATSAHTGSTTSAPTPSATPVQTSSTISAPTTSATSVHTGSTTSAPTTSTTSVHTGSTTSAPTTSATPVQTSSTISAPTTSATPVQTSSTTSAPTTSTTPVQTSSTISAPTTSSTSVHTSSITSAPTPSATPVQRSRTTSAPTTSTTSVHTGSTTSAPTPSATPVQTSSTISAPTTSATSVHTGSTTSAPTTSTTSVHTGSTTSAPTTSATSAHTGSTTSAPTPSATPVQTSSTISAPTTSATSVHTGSTTSAPTTSTTSVHTGSTTSAPTTSATPVQTSSTTSAPTTSTTSVHTSSATSAPTTSTTSVQTSSTISAPTTSSTSVHTSSTTSAPTPSATPVQTSSTTSAPTTSTTSVHTSSATSAPTTSTTSVQTSSTISAPTTSSTSVHTSSTTSAPTPSATPVQRSRTTSAPTTSTTSVQTSSTTSAPTTSTTSVHTSSATSVHTSSATSAPTTSTTSVQTGSTTSAPTTSSTSVPVSGTTPCSCSVSGQLHSAGSNIYQVTDLSGHCYYAFCSLDCHVVKGTAPTCPTSMPPPTPTTSSPESSPSTSVSVPPQGCPNAVPPRTKGETWPMPNCSEATCQGNGVITVSPRRCPRVQKPTCANGYPAVQVADRDGCCPHYQCQCVCSGWGDPHYITFDGTYYTFLDNCTYVLVQQIVPVYGHFRVLVENYFCNSEDGLSCPQSIIVEYRENRVVLVRRPVHGVMTNEIIFNGEVVRPGFQKGGIAVSQVGIKMYVSIPELGVWVMFSGLIFSVEVPFSKFANNTEGQCGTCTNDQKDECRLPGGEVVASCSNMSSHWKVAYPGQPPCNRPPPTPTPVEPRTSPTPCPPSPICQLILSKPFELCHVLIPPWPYYQGCTFDRCHMPGTDVVCSALELYAALCASLGVCIDWRGQTNYTCPFTCPAGMEYRPCGPPSPSYCYMNSSASPLALLEPSPITEGCFCPQGTMLYSSSKEVCVPTDCNACLGPSGEPVEPGHTVSVDCQECTCEGGTQTMSCRPRTCPPAPACPASGQVPVPEAMQTGQCCPQYRCACDIRHCPEPEACPKGSHAVQTYREAACCPAYSCSWTVCSINGTLYQPGAMVSSSLCEKCWCELPGGASSDTFSINCETQICGTSCPLGFKYQARAGQCCGECVQVACVINTSNSSVHLFYPGESWSDPGDHCISHECERHQDGLVVVTTKKACPPLNCSADKALPSEDGCCLFCPLPNRSACTVHHQLQVLRLQGCSSPGPVLLAYCRGNCGDTTSMFSPEANAVAHQCSCCREQRVSLRNVTLRCEDGSSRALTYTEVEECGCAGLQCDSPGGLGLSAVALEPSPESGLRRRGRRAPRARPLQ
ncbi:mucin-5AC isoform X2 [Ovis aries]|uniref:mucin-5AC isoform X2 n=1 Tax=Ovis aries TaxID=9940 RepID=UPI0029528384|nr:mucin-5AC isoform X2 [Ovis aries]